MANHAPDPDMRLIYSLTATVLLLSACAVQTEKAALSGRDSITADDVLNHSPIDDGSVKADLASIDMLEMSPEMIRFVEEAVGDVHRNSERLRYLAYAVMRSGQFELVYDDSTRTAADTFAARRGNCLAFTNMFVAMSRYIGLDASYQEVDVPPNWSMSGQSYLYSQHINVFIDLKRDHTTVVDFNLYDFESEYETRLIDDDRARAHYFNNIGAEKMLADESPLALAYFRQSLGEDPTFAPAWINLGILHRREGYPSYAEAAYLRALDLDSGNLIALSNLANLYEELGRPELAEDYQARVEVHRMRNPYYRYQKANLAFMDGDYETAIEDLKFAIRRRKHEDQFYFLLSLSYLMSGDKEEARAWMKKAEEVASQNSDRQKYHHKLDLLMNPDAG
jgi:Flp pilus assembly protein TadD